MRRPVELVSSAVARVAQVKVLALAAVPATRDDRAHAAQVAAELHLAEARAAGLAMSAHEKLARRVTGAMKQESDKVDAKERTLLIEQEQRQT